MYNEFFGFTTRPFHITPDLDFLFMTPAHKEALACMEFGLIADTGIVMVTGEIGTGKTTLIRKFLDDLPADVKAACILNTNITPEQLLEIFLQEFGIDAPCQQKALAIKAIQGGLLKMRADNQRPLLIVDDAQNLSFEALEEIRWLSNLQDDHRMLVQIILVGQTELNTKLAQSALASLAQRIGAHFHLEAFSREHVGTYIAHRLVVAGVSEDLFTPEAVDLIYETTRGIPRRVNLLCENALVYAYADDARTIDLAIVKQVAAETLPGSGAAGLKQVISDAAAMDPGSLPPGGPKDSHAADLQEKFSQLEIRLDALEQLALHGNMEMLDMIKKLLVDERTRCNKLLTENTLLKARVDALQKKDPNAALLPAKNRTPQETAHKRETEILELYKKKGKE